MWCFYFIWNQLHIDNKLFKFKPLKSVSWLSCNSSVSYGSSFSIQNGWLHLFTIFFSIWNLQVKNKCLRHTSDTSAKINSFGYVSAFFMMWSPIWMGLGLNIDLCEFVYAQNHPCLWFSSFSQSEKMTHWNIICFILWISQKNALTPVTWTDLKMVCSQIKSKLIDWSSGLCLSSVLHWTSFINLLVKLCVNVFWSKWTKNNHTTFAKNYKAHSQPVPNLTPVLRVSTAKELALGQENWL